MDKVEEQLKVLLAAPEQPADENFALRVHRLIAAENQVRASRRAIWRGFWLETAASMAILVAAYSIWSFTPPLDHQGAVRPFSPAFISLLIMAVWIACFSRPGSSAEG